jgi:transcriptional regulator with XRE-family HTH domain
VNEELFTGDLDIRSAQTRGQLAALLRTIHLRADRPSLRTLEARTRHHNVPLSKTVVSEMLKGTRFPRKAVMISFLHACGVPEDRMEPWRRAWERIAADEQDQSESAARWAPAMQDQRASGSVCEVPSAIAEQAGGGEMPITRADGLGGTATAASAELGADEPQDPVSRTDPGRGVPGPMVRRRELAAVLRALRVSAGMTIEQVADRLLCSPSKVSRMETGFRTVTMRDVRDLCDLYRVADSQRRDLMELAREGRKPGWWQSYDLHYATFLGLEADATSIDNFEVSVFPGLLQTADYARAIIEKMSLHPSPEKIDKGVAARLKRQQLLIQDNPPPLRVIVDESALRRIIGSPSVMKAQLDHIIKISSLPNVSVQVIPYDTGAYPALDSCFTILEFASPVPGVIYVEGLIGLIYLERPQDVERYQRIFRDMHSIAATEQESITLIAEASEGFNTDI